MVLTSPAVRRIRTPGWLDLRLVLGVLLVVAAVTVGAIVVADADRTVSALAVTNDLGAGSRLGADDVQVVRVRLPEDGTARYLRARTEALGKQLNRPMTRGELLPAAAVADAPTQTTVSVPFGEGAAPRLHPGARIEVWLSTASCPPVVVLSDVAVQEVHEAEGARLGVRGGQDVVLSLDPPLAERMVAALARDGATVRAGVLSGPARTAGGALPALDECPGASATP